MSLGNELCVIINYHADSLQKDNINNRPYHLKCIRIAVELYDLENEGLTLQENNNA